MNKQQEQKIAKFHKNKFSKKYQELWDKLKFDQHPEIVSSNGEKCQVDEFEGIVGSTGARWSENFRTPDDTAEKEAMEAINSWKKILKEKKLKWKP